MAFVCHFLSFLLNILLVQYALAYIPAHTTNDTAKLDPATLGTLSMRWPPAGMFNVQVASQLKGNASHGYSAGALVHFSDEYQKLVNASTAAPWVALIDCDNVAGNATSSFSYDIFSSASDRGAVAAILYSATSQACFLNPEFKQSSKIMDIYTTVSSATARLINAQFSNVDTKYSEYNPTLLDGTKSVIDNYLKPAGSPPKDLPPYLMTWLISADAINASVDPSFIHTAPASQPTAASSTPTQTPASPSSTTNGSDRIRLVMSVLFSIAGCVLAFTLA